jgi:hypothetical protein
VAETFSKMTIAEMGESIRISKEVDMMGHQGWGRRLYGNDEPYELRAGAPEMTRAAIVAFNVYAQDAIDEGRMDRDEASGRFGRALRIAVVEDRDRGDEPRTDADRARMIVTAVSLVEAFEQHVPGFVPEDISKVGEDRVDRAPVDFMDVTAGDANRFAIGMPDMIEDPKAALQLKTAMDASWRVDVDPELDMMVARHDALVPASPVVVEERPVARSTTRGPEAAPVVAPVQAGRGVGGR